MLLTLALILSPAPTLADANLNALLSQKVAHYAQAHRRSLKAARDFDRELDDALASGEAGLLRRSGAYRQLLALRELKHADADAIGSALTELAATNPREAEAAGKMLEARLGGLGDTASALALNGELSAEFGFGVSDVSALSATPAATPVAVAGGFGASFTLDLMPSLLDLEIAQTAARLDFSAESSVNGLRPDARIRPGTGPEGNITGNNFPEKTWALTFDDGPSGKYTRQIVDTVTAHGKKATFFWLAQNVSGNRPIVAYAKAAGMSLNDHSFTHANLSKASASTLNHEIVESAELEAKIYGKRPEFFRLPYGAGVNMRGVREIIAAENMIHVFWNVDSLDWQDKDPSSVFARVRKQMALERKGVILFHDIHPQSLAATKLLLDYSDSLNGSRGQLRWVTLPEIRDELNGK